MKERGGNNKKLGNITKQILQPSEYKDTIFIDILINMSKINNIFE